MKKKRRFVCLRCISMPIPFTKYADDHPMHQAECLSTWVPEPRKRRALRREPEHVEQKQLFRWARLHEDRVPELRLLFAVPNGGERHLFVAKKLKAEGVKPGVPDVWLPVRRFGYTGLVLELKAPGRVARVSDAQFTWHERLIAEGWRVEVCDSWQEAWNHTVGHLGRADLAQQIPGGVA